MAGDEHYLKRELDEGTKGSVMLSFLQSSILDGLWYRDLENPEHEWMSPEFWQLLGFDPSEKEHLASEWRDLIHPEDLLLATENLRRHCEDPNHPYDQIVRYKHRHGFTVWVRCRGVAIRKDGKPIRLLGAHIDVTSQQNAVTKLAGLVERQRLELAQMKAGLAEERSALERWSHLEFAEPSADLLASARSPKQSAPIGGAAMAEQLQFGERYRAVFASSLTSSDNTTGHQGTRALAALLGEGNGRAADVIGVHLDLSRRSERLLPPYGRAMRDRGRLFALEVMGHLAEFYRLKLARKTDNRCKEDA